MESEANNNKNHQHHLIIEEEEDKTHQFPIEKHQQHHHQNKAKRVASLDIFRGLTVAVIIYFFDSLSSSSS